MGPEILPRCGGIALRHWKLTIVDLSFGTICHNCKGPVDFDDCHFGMLYDALMAQVNPTHLEYFRFSGRMIALALMHDLQIEVVFDRVFFLHLAGKDISLQDIKDADPILYNIYKQILNMDLEMVD
ncbi:hypothetical protein CQW23_02372 [Capsicum baccatum]|uniref:HECT-type E3 ubiquitin transferase n=1 Tax=Capsicum baccatum TaxID=33114 RepID=A0A2G2XRD1_CAPBA|nr:hypothetical protein CQW23_02372 [Capsicum baccatum]